MPPPGDFRATRARFEGYLASPGVRIARQGRQMVQTRRNFLEVAFIDVEQLSALDQSAVTLVRLKAFKMEYVGFVGIVSESHFVQQYLGALSNNSSEIGNLVAPQYKIDTSRMLYLSSYGHTNHRFN